MSENTRKTAIVTGASRGIGKAIALKLAKSGYNIAIVDACPLEMSKDAEDEVKALGVDAKAYQCNVADFEKVGETVAQINEDFGGIYILVNNAGITRDSLLLKMTEENFDSVIAVNLKGNHQARNTFHDEEERGKSRKYLLHRRYRRPGRPGKLFRFQGRNHRRNKVLR